MESWGCEHGIKVMLDNMLCMEQVRVATGAFYFLQHECMCTSCMEMV
jgi:hypothetical protein